MIRRRVWWSGIVVVLVVWCLTADEVSSSMNIFEAESRALEYLDNHPHHKINKRATVEKETTDFWPNSTTYYYLSPALDGNLTQKAAWVFVYLANITCLRFVPLNGTAVRNWRLGYVNVSVSPSDICYVDTGFPGYGKSSTMYLGTECANNYHNMAHLALHGLGFFHEHQRPDRGYYVQVFWQNIAAGLALNFQLYSVNATDYSSPYDTSSIMHFQSSFDQKNGLMVLQPLLHLYWSKNNAFDNLGGGSRVITNPFSHRDLAKLNSIYSCACMFNTPMGNAKSIICPNPGNCSDTASQARCVSNYGFIDQCCRCICPEGFSGLYCDTYTMTDVTNNCGGIITSGVGTISSPSYPSPYQTGVKCRYLLQNPDKTGKVCLLINDLSIYDSVADSLYVRLYYPGVNFWKLDVEESVNFLQNWYMSQTEMASIEFFSNYTCPGGNCNTAKRGFKITYNIGCVGMESSTTLGKLAWNTNPDMAYLGLYPPDNLRVGTCNLIPCISDGNCAPEKAVWDTYMCGCSAIAGESERCRPAYNIQTFHVVARVNAQYIDTLSDPKSFDFYTLKARICNWAYDGIAHLNIAANYRSCFRMTAKNGSVIVDYTFAFNTSFGISSTTLNNAFRFPAANASEGKIRLVNDLAYTISDVDECADLSLWECPAGSRCVNTNGRYTCTCDPGCRYVWPYGARVVGYCTCDNSTNNGGGGNGNSGGSSFSNSGGVFQWWWIVVGLCAFLFVACCCCVPLGVYCWRKRRVYADEEIEEEQDRLSYRSSDDGSWARRPGDSRWLDGPRGENYPVNRFGGGLPRTIIRTAPQAVRPTNYFI